MAQAQTKVKSDFFRAITQLATERGLSAETVLEAVEQAMVSAYKKDYAANGTYRANVDQQSGEVRIFAIRQVVEDVADEIMEISLAEARVLDPKAEIGGQVEMETTPPNFGRIAAQTAKQVILQRIREAERDAVFQTFSDRAGELVSGTVQSIDSRGITLSLGRAEALLPKGEQVPGERYRLRQRLRVYVLEVNKTARGPEIIVSRANRGMIKRLLELEVPEVYNGAVEVKAIAREPGSRSKLAVAALQPGVDPVGACVGMRGVRIQSIVNELGGERIDVIEWSKDPREFIAKALSPARPLSVELLEIDGVKTAIAAVPESQLSLAIGRDGQNVRLAAKLTGWRIDLLPPAEAQERISKLREIAIERALVMPEEAAPQAITVASPISALDLPTRVAVSLEKGGVATVGDILEKLQQSEENLLAIAGVGPKSVEQIRERINALGLHPEAAMKVTAPPQPEAVPQVTEVTELVPEEAPATAVEAPPQAKPFVEEEEVKRKKPPSAKKRAKPGRRREDWREELEQLGTEELEMQPGLEEEKEDGAEEEDEEVKE